MSLVSVSVTGRLYVSLILGIMQIFGRFFPGIVVDKTRITSTYLCTMGMVGCAIVCFLFPFCRTFSTLMSFSAFYGFFIGMYSHSIEAIGCLIYIARTTSYKKSLKIWWQSESVYRRRTENTIAKRKSTKVLKTGGELRCSGRVGSSCCTSAIRWNKNVNM